jgi:hypothetical protein
MRETELVRRYYLDHYDTPKRPPQPESPAVAHGLDHTEPHRIGGANPFPRGRTKLGEGGDDAAPAAWTRKVKSRQLPSLNSHL